MARKPGIPRRTLARLERMPGSARRWRDPETGATYSDRLVRQSKAGGLTLEELAMPYAVRSIARRVQRLIRERDGTRIALRVLTTKRPRRRLTPAERAARAELDALRAALESKSTSPRGKKARALVQLGLRPADATYKVGESPKGAPPWRYESGRLIRTRGTGSASARHRHRLK